MGVPRKSKMPPACAPDSTARCGAQSGNVENFFSDSQALY
jgi:hypothetical protein